MAPERIPYRCSLPGLAEFGGFRRTGLDLQQKTVLFELKKMAEEVGFEPTERLRSDALQAPAFDPSATPPQNMLDSSIF